MKRLKKIAVYFRNALPGALERHIQVDKEMKLHKDGVFTHNGVRCPRVTISFEWDGSKPDQERLEKMTRLLEELENNNQIIAFSVKG